MRISADVIRDVSDMRRRLRTRRTFKFVPFPFMRTKVRLTQNAALPRTIYSTDKWRFNLPQSTDAVTTRRLEIPDIAVETSASVNENLLMKLLRHTHCRFIPLIANYLPFFELICSRVLNFIKLCSNSDSELVRDIVRHCACTSHERSRQSARMLFSVPLDLVSCLRIWFYRSVLGT